MTEVEHASDSELEDPNRITDAASCLDYLKRREVFLYKMMNDPSHKAMLYFLEVLMNSDSPVTVDQLAARFSHKSFSPDMREACGGGSAEGLREFLQRYPSLFNVSENGQVTSVSIELPGVDVLPDGMSDVDLCIGSSNHLSSISGESNYSTNQSLNAEPSLFSLSKSSKSSGGLRTGKNRLNSTVGDNSKLKSTSSLSLASSPSNHSSQSSSGSMSSFPGGQNGQTRRGDETHASDKNRPTLNGTANLCRRVSNPNVCGWNKGTAVYQPPPLREQARLVAMTNTTCELCHSKLQLCSNTESANVPVNSRSTCVHCPLIDLTCHHHCPATTHHHVQTHCLCTTHRLASTTHCHHCHPMHAPSNNIRSNLMPTTYCALPPMEKLLLETEAVRFFQQRLLKREERWVQIKSLAGHLSQATPEVRAVVGPQLEFRQFLLKHPHVFEVQGELVSVRDPFSNIPTQRRTRDRYSGSNAAGNTSGIHTSFSSNNLVSSSLNHNASPGGFAKPIGASERVQRPKSLILTTPQQLGALAFGSIANANNRRNPEHRRSTHFAENFVTASYPASGGASCSGSTSSAPTTPTGSNPTITSSQRGVTFKPINRRETIADGFFTQSLLSAATGVSSSTDVEPLTNLSSTMPSLNTSNSISISMSANEYRAIMFLRKVLEKRGGAPGQLGLALNELMLFLASKAPESVRATIGWTKIELEEFVCQHNLFFDVRRGSAPKAVNGAPNSATTNGPNNEPLILVTNKRLERMINIVITGTNPVDGNARTLTNRCGRIFHVAKLWGIIDLGRHEHVFFDKSIFKHVDDLQKHFQVNELLYFNAILAPKESRAKWRATQVWKECDRENVEKLGGLSCQPFRGQSRRKNDFAVATNGQSTSVSGSTGATGSGINGRLNGSAMKSQSPPGNHQIHKPSELHHATGPEQTAFQHQHFNENEDTEADVDDLEVDGTSQAEKFPRKSHMEQTTANEKANHESDCEFDLTGEEALEDEEESFAAAVAREEGLHLINDVRFVTDNSVLDDDGPPDVALTKQSKTQVTSSRRDVLLLSSSSNRTKHNPLSSTSSEPVGHNFVSSSTEQNHLDYVPGTHSMTCSLKEDGTMSSSSTGSGGISIAVQTVSTGEIMATQLYHDPNRQSCSPAQLSGV